MVGRLEVLASISMVAQVLVAIGPTVVSDDFVSKAAIATIGAVLGAVLGFLSAYLLDLLRSKREPRKRLSYDTKAQRGLISVTPAMRRNMRVLYREQQIEDIGSVECTVANTGNRAVKNTYVRFALPDKCVILDAELDPEPERELGVKEAADPAAVANKERRYLLGHLEVGQEVRFRLIVSGQSATHISIHHLHEEGDLVFSRRDIAREADDREHVVPFLISFSLLLVIPAALAITIPLLGGILASIAALILFASLAPHIRPVARTVDALVAVILALRPPEPTVHVNLNSGTVRGDLLVAGQAATKVTRPEEASEASD